MPTPLLLNILFTAVINVPSTHHKADKYIMDALVHLTKTLSTLVHASFYISMASTQGKFILTVVRDQYINDLLCRVFETSFGMHGLVFSARLIVLDCLDTHWLLFSLVFY